MFRITLFLMLVSCTSTFAQRKLETQRTSVPPKIDGRITESNWSMVSPAIDFITTSPDYGKPASKKTQVWVLYDDEAIYVAAKLFDNPKEIKKQLTARDKEQRQNVDFSAFFLILIMIIKMLFNLR